MSNKNPKIYKKMTELSNQQKYDHGLITLDELKIFNRDFRTIKAIQQFKAS